MRTTATAWAAKLSDAAAVMVIGDAARGEQLAERRRRLCMCHTAPAKILAELRASNKEHVRVGEGRPVHNAIGAPVAARW